MAIKKLQLQEVLQSKKYRIKTSISRLCGAGDKDVCFGDARSLDLIEPESIDLIATHPPYASIIPYSHDRVGDLSSVHNIAEFAAKMGKVAGECMCILRPGKHCAILMCDSRRNKHFIPITQRVLMSFLEARVHTSRGYNQDAMEKSAKFKESMK